MQISETGSYISTRPQEECGISAIVSKRGEKITQFLGPIQYHLRHRGQDAAGMAVFNSQGGISLYKKGGLVGDVFPENFDYQKNGMLSDRGIAHNRYGTDQSGRNRENESGAQPMVAEREGWEIAVAFNGNLPDSERNKLRGRLPREWREETFDTLEIARAIVSAQGEKWEDKIRNALVGVTLAYSITMQTGDGKVFGLRGPTGTWPLWVGETDKAIVFASESRVENAEVNGNNLGEFKWTEVNPGELVEATQEGVRRTRLFDSEGLFRCSLHDSYGARADSLMTEDKTYGDFRQEIGRILAQEHPIQADIYMGLPQTGLTFAEGYAHSLGVEPTLIIEKMDDRRAYITVDDENLADVMNGKYYIPGRNRKLIEGKSVVVTEDSLIKGTTAGGDKKKGIKGFVELLREAGAREVHVLTALQRFVDGCDMGYVIDKNKLVAVERQEDGRTRVRSAEEIAVEIGADSFGFVSRDGMQEAYENTSGHSEVACMSCQGDLHPLEIINLLNAAS